MLVGDSGAAMARVISGVRSCDSFWIENAFTFSTRKRDASDPAANLVNFMIFYISEY